MAQAEDNTIYQGQQKVLTLRLRDALGDPWDVTGKTVRARFKLSGVVKTKDCVISGDGLIGRVLLTLLDSQTVLLEEGNLVLDVAIGTFVTAVDADWSTASDTIEQILTDSSGFVVVALGNGVIT